MDSARDSVTHRWPAWLNATGLLFASVIAIAAFAFHVRPGAEIVAVLFPPWWSSQQVFAAIASADAAIVRTTAVSTLMVVRPDDHEGMARLRNAGVWLALDPQAVAACFIKTKEI
jgi:hypothetical protein